ncbi:hypothetical protein D920_02755 [Enterococcus faecalis 13-SD-W-01]|nr:hypothetical protein D920_02755 [Enterococcus faecalis 13-SD-W-01]
MPQFLFFKLLHKSIFFRHKSNFGVRKKCKNYLHKAAAINSSAENDKEVKKGMQKFFLAMSIFLCWIGLAIKPKEVAASSAVSFSVEALNKDGESNAQGFYRFEGKPGEKEQVKVKITNGSKQPIKIAAEVNPAFTNTNGIPSYQKSEQLDNTLKYPLDSLVQIEKQEIDLEAGSSQIIAADIEYPKEIWEGQILGGIRFSEIINAETAQSVTHQIAYTIGVLLTMENGVVRENNLQLNKVEVGQRNHRNYIEANIQNTAPAIISAMEIKAEVYQKNDKKPIYQYEANEMRMAPNSNFDFGIPTGEVPLQPGDYKLKLKVEADSKKYEFEKSFEIKASESKRLNQSAVNLEIKENTMIYWGIIIALLFIIVIGSMRKKYKNKRAKIN